MNEEKKIIESRLVQTSKTLPVLIILLGLALCIPSMSVSWEWDMGWIWLVIGVCVALIGVVILLYVGNCQMVVTNKRVYGTAAFGKRVDLPIDSVSAVALSYFNTVSVATSSGRIAFVMLDNKEEIHRAISQLISNRQSTSNGVIVSEADDIKKFKELLDMGAINQEEFDAKKKQLLGL